MMKKPTCLLFLLLLLPSLVWAQESIAWYQLSEQERRMLAPLQEDWGNMHPQRQQRFLNGARRWQSFDGEERAQVQRRFREWDQLSVEQREVIRQRFEQYSGLPPQQQNMMRDRFREFQDMPEERRRNLREEFQQRRLQGPPGGRPGFGNGGMPPGPPGNPRSR